MVSQNLADSLYRSAICAFEHLTGYKQANSFITHNADSGILSDSFYSTLDSALTNDQRYKCFQANTGCQTKLFLVDIEKDSIIGFVKDRRFEDLGTNECKYISQLSDCLNVQHVEQLSLWEENPSDDCMDSVCARKILQQARDILGRMPRAFILIEIEFSDCCQIKGHILDGRCNDLVGSCDIISLCTPQAIEFDEGTAGDIAVATKQDSPHKPMVTIRKPLDNVAEK